MKKLTICLLALSGIANAQYNDLGGPTLNLRGDAIAAQAGVATLAGADANGALVLVRTSGNVTALRAFTHLGGLVKTRAIAVVGDGEAVVGGSVEISGSTRAFLTRVNSFNGLVAWTIIEPPRTVSTSVDSLVLGADFVAVGTQLQGASGAVAYELATGIERWRTTVPSTIRRQTELTLRANQDVFLSATTDISGGTAGFVRCISPAGVVRWSRQLSTKTMERTRLTQANDALIALGTNSVLVPTTLSFFRLNPNTGSILRSLAQPRNIALSPPLLETSKNRVICRFSELSGAFTPGVRKALIMSDDLTATIEQDRLPDGTDKASCPALAPDSSPHFVSNSFNPNSQGEVSRETPDIVKTITDVSEFQGIATDGNKVFVYGPFVGGGVKVHVLEPQPFAFNDLFEQIAVKPLRVSAPGILANDIGAGGSTIVLVTPPTKGNVTIDPDGSFVYDPIPKKFLGEDSFQYRLTKGSLSSATVTVTVRFQPAPLRIDLSSTRVKGGAALTGVIVFDGQRQITAGTYPVSSTDPLVAAPANNTVVVPVGADRSPPFVINTNPVFLDSVVSIFTNDGSTGGFAFGDLVVIAPLVRAIRVEKTTVVGGNPASFILELDSPAPSAGLVVDISDNSTAIAVPTRAVIPAGTTSVQFSAPTAAVATSRTAVVTAARNGTIATVTLAIVGVSLSLNPTSVVGGQSSTGTLSLTSNAIVNSVVFDLTDNSTSTGFTGTQKGVVPEGFLSGQFTIISVPVTSNRTSTITATNGVVVRTATLSVQAPTVGLISLSPSPVVGGNPFAGVVQLTGKAPTAGVTVTLSDNATFVSMPPSVFIAGANDLGLWLGTTQVVTASTMVIVTASLNGQSRTITIVVTP